MATGNPMYMEVSMGKSSINGGFSIAMLDYWRVDGWYKHVQTISQSWLVDGIVTIVLTKLIQF